MSPRQARVISSQPEDTPVSSEAAKVASNILASTPRTIAPVPHLAFPITPPSVTPRRFSSGAAYGTLTPARTPPPKYTVSNRPERLRDDDRSAKQHAKKTNIRSPDSRQSQRDLAHTLTSHEESHSSRLWKPARKLTYNKSDVDSLLSDLTLSSDAGLIPHEPLENRSHNASRAGNNHVRTIHSLSTSSSLTHHSLLCDRPGFTLIFLGCRKNCRKRSRLL